MSPKCTNTSPPSSREMNPKPLESLNHFTVPLFMVSYLLLVKLKRRNCTIKNRKDEKSLRSCLQITSATSGYIISYQCTYVKLYYYYFSHHYNCTKYQKPDSLRLKTVCGHFKK